jgi:hypothetical protein
MSRSFVIAPRAQPIEIITESHDPVGRSDRDPTWGGIVFDGTAPPSGQKRPRSKEKPRNPSEMRQWDEARNQNGKITSPINSVVVFGKIT